MEIDPLFAGMNASTTGMTAQRKRMNAIAENLANAETTRTASGEPYRRKQAVFNEKSDFDSALTSAVNNKLQRTDAFHIPGQDQGSARVRMGGVEADIVEDPSDFQLVYDPEHPDADEDGMVKMPNVDIVKEMTELIAASRAFEANATAFNATKGMMKKALEL
jgi:flagellar basal-body rod protein FlgC